MHGRQSRFDGDAARILLRSPATDWQSFEDAHCATTSSATTTFLAVDYLCAVFGDPHQPISERIAVKTLAGPLGFHA